MDIGQLDPDQVYSCRVRSIEGEEEGTWNEAELTFMPVYDQTRSSVESVIVLNEDDQPCYEFQPDHATDEGFRSSSWEVEILGEVL